MNLKKQYQRLFEGRKGHAKANNLIMKDSLLKEAPSFRPGDDYGGGPSPQGSDAPGGEQETLDIEYYSDQLNKIFTELEEFHQELGTNIEMSFETTGDYQYEVMEKQVSRYIMGAIKQIEGLQKYIERQKNKGL